jgi:hypothetical protein
MQAKPFLRKGNRLEPAMIEIAFEETNANGRSAWLREPRAGVDSTMGRCIQEQK